MNARQIVLRNREVNLNTEKVEKSAFKGVTTRKRAGLKALGNANVDQDLKLKKCESKLKPTISESKIESIDMSIDNKENESLTLENMIENPFTWPTGAEMIIPTHKETVLQTLVSRRAAIRQHYKQLNNDGIPIWFPGEAMSHDEYMHAEYQANIHDYLMDTELSFNPIGRQFLESSKFIGPRQRYIFINWIVQSHSRFAMCAETLHLTVAICDRFIKAHRDTIKVADLAIIGIVSLFISAKIEEVWPPTLSELIKHFDVEYTPDFCKQLEVRIIATLECKMSIPLPISFIRHYNIIIEASTLSHYLSRYFCELSIQDYEASSQSINLIACSCIFLAQVICQNTVDNFPLVWSERLQTSSGLLYSDIRPLVRNLCVVVSKQRASSNYRAVSTKYNSERLMNVYCHSLNSPALQNLLLHFKSELRQPQ